MSDHLTTSLMDRFADQVNSWMGKPTIFMIGVWAVVIWLLSGPVFKFSDTWQLVINTSTTIITFLVGLLLINSGNRAQGKLELLIKNIEHMMLEQDQLLVYLTKKLKEDLADQDEILEILTRIESRKHKPQ